MLPVAEFIKTEEWMSWNFSLIFVSNFSSKCIPQSIATRLRKCIAYTLNDLQKMKKGGGGGGGGLHCNPTLPSCSGPMLFVASAPAGSPGVCNAPRPYEGIDCKQRWLDAILETQCNFSRASETITKNQRHFSSGRNGHIQYTVVVVFFPSPDLLYAAWNPTEIILIYLAEYLRVRSAFDTASS